ncbi:MAG: response regulator, partial [Firmicutes bacterium]|nr:response regulator [Bacillota bacterium]
MRLLLVEDKDSFRRLLVQALGGAAFANWQVRAVGDPREALEALEAQPFDLLVTDLRLPGFSGLELMRRARLRQPNLRTLLMSAFGEAADIVEAMRWGAEDFLPKPFDLDHFLNVLERLQAQIDAPPPDGREAWIAHSPALRALSDSLAKAAESDAPVLFVGEAGTGRSRAARRLHWLRQPTAPFQAIAAECFEPEKQNLDRGTIFLQELDLLLERALSALFQAMERPNLRWMASVRSLDDLLPRLRERLVLTFHLPPLRERREDIVPLFRVFLERSAQAHGRPMPLVERGVEKDLLQRPWPGHARELAQCAEQAAANLQGPVLNALPAPETVGKATLALPWPEPGSME